MSDAANARGRKGSAASGTAKGAAKRGVGAAGRGADTGAAREPEAAGAEGGRCLVVGYDRSKSARNAASWAASQLGEGERMVLVHSCRALHVPASPLQSARERRELGQALLDELLLEGDDALLEKVTDTEVTEADPVSALTAAAQRHNASGIVVGREQHSRLHAAIGTVTRELLTHASVPVTVVPPAGG